ncbi:MAG: hypothetical protein JXA81_10830 [Sedimentisphaerales bacterium]|nr:hypothetical protein [Sedimentisphaerales bacterium]
MLASITAVVVGSPYPKVIVLLHAERAGSDDGRIYTIYVVCEDALGNSAEASLDVTVPHDNGKGKKK